MGAVTGAIVKDKEAKKEPTAETKAAVIYSLAGFLLIGGFAAPILGTILFIIYSVFPDHRIFDRIGSLFLYLSIPMLLLGSHFLDKFDERRQSLKKLP